MREYSHYVIGICTDGGNYSSREVLFPNYVFRIHMATELNLMSKMITWILVQVCAMVMSLCFYEALMGYGFVGKMIKSVCK